MPAFKKGGKVVKVPGDTCARYKFFKNRLTGLAQVYGLVKNSKTLRQAKKKVAPFVLQKKRFIANARKNDPCKGSQKKK